MLYKEHKVITAIDEMPLGLRVWVFSSGFAL